MFTHKWVLFIVLIILVILLTILVTSCAFVPPAKIAEQHGNTWIGASLDSAIMQFGPPSSSSTLSNGNTVVMWSQQHNYTTGGGTIVSPTLGFNSTSEYVGSSWSSQNLPTYQESETCRLIFMIRDNRIIDANTNGGCEVPEYKYSTQSDFTSGVNGFEMDTSVQVPRQKEDVVPVVPVVKGSEAVGMRSLDNNKSIYPEPVPPPKKPVKFDVAKMNGMWKFSFKEDSNKRSAFSVSGFLRSGYGVIKARLYTLTIYVINPENVRLTGMEGTWSEVRVINYSLMVGKYKRINPNNGTKYKWSMKAERTG